MRRLNFVLPLVLAGCGAVSIPIVTVSDSDGGFRPPMGRPCLDNQECGGGELCDKVACDDEFGRCVRRPAFCDGDARPECGCDGVTYWNECLRRAAGVASRSGRGECVNPRTCDETTEPCPEGAICARLIFPNECSLPASGACYVLPDVCEGDTRDHYFSCTDVAQSQCLDGCAAIRSGQKSVRFPGACP